MTVSPIHPHSFPLHVDLIHNQWASGYQELVERIPPDHPNASRNGEYIYASSPHTIQNCPFRDTARIPFTYQGGHDAA